MNRATDRTPSPSIFCGTKAPQRKLVPNPTVLATADNEFFLLRRLPMSKLMERQTMEKINRFRNQSAPLAENNSLPCRNKAQMEVNNQITTARQKSPSIL